MSSEIPPLDPDDGVPDPANAGQGDTMGPPEVSCECTCMHCGRIFMSDQMWFQRVIGDPTGFDGFWMCPTPNCAGAGFTFDIFPTDPHHPANDGWHYDDDEIEDDAPDDEWDPSESKYQDFDDEDDDLEGDEWKHGLSPGQPGEPDWMTEARQQQEEEQRQYDEPDRRPREIEWTGKDDGGAGMIGGELPF